MVRKAKYVQKAFIDPLGMAIGEYEVMPLDQKRRNPVARLADFGKLNKDQVRESLDDILGQEVEITSVEIREGNYGPFVRFECKDFRGKVHNVSTGAFLVVDALQDALEQGALPVQARFVKKGRTYTFA